ncbi:MAG: hypothetical protein KatS3mg015_2322 [Fimbriimonadales bacterium]|nr:MAG: hypothetical protein KatS3mg015_2322 [Fimbriimonadales bacterium]
MIAGMDSVVAAAVAALSVTAAPTAQPQWVPGTRDAVSSMNSLFGPTGLIATPTAYSTEHREGRFGAFFGDGISTASGNYGLIPYIELGGAYVDRTGADDKLVANAKVTLIPQNFRNFEVGVGVIDAFDAIEQTFYVVGSADLVVPEVRTTVRGEEFQSIGLKVHAGAGNGIFDEELFVGGELLFTKNVSVVGEWDTNDFNAALRYAHKDYFSLQLGFFSNDFFLSATTRLRF